MVRLAAYGGVSCVLATYVVLSAFRQRSNFFSAAVYLSKSNACMMILWNLGVFITILFGRGLQSIFFGPLRLLEVERLHERAWYAVTESLLALTIFRDEFDTSFVVLFVSLLFLKVFHWLASDRVEMMEQSPSIPRIFHMRMITVLSTLWLFDLVLILFAAESIFMEGPSVMIMFASEYMIMLAMLLGTTLKYAVNVYDLRSDIPWDNKSVFIFYIDLACDFLKLTTYLCFFSLILTFYGLPLNILRDVYITARSFVLKVRDLARYRQATRNMDERYPNATHEEMERTSDKTCIICREDMEARRHDERPPAEQQQQAAARTGRQGPNDTPKKLPCGHIFHFHCLRSWLERQQSCPTCRRPVLTSSAAPIRQAPGHAAPPGAAAGQQPPLPQPGQIARLPGNNLALPAPTPSARSSSRNGDPTREAHRSRRAGLENPLVAFQLPILPGPSGTSQSQAQAESPSSARPQAVNSQTAMQGISAPVVSGPSLTSQQPSAPHAPERSGITALDERSARRLRLEAAARNRQAGTIGLSSSPMLSPSITPSIPSPGPIPPINQSDSSAQQSNSGYQTATPTVPPPTSTIPTATPIIKVEVPLPSSEAVTSALMLQPGLGTGSAAPSENLSPDAPRPPPIPSVREDLSTSSISSQPEHAISSRDPEASPIVETAASTKLNSHSSDPRSSFSQSRSSNMYVPLLRSPNSPAGSSLHIRTSEGDSLQANEMPRLIPLFDPSNPRHPSSLARFLPSLRDSLASRNFLSSLPGHIPSAPSPSLPDNLTKDQLAMLADVTKDSLEVRMKLLQNTQETLQVCMRQMQEAISIISTGDLQGVLQVAAELNESTLIDRPNGREIGLKGKRKADDQNDPSVT